MTIIKSRRRILIAVPILILFNLSAQAQIKVASWAIIYGADMSQSELKMNDFKNYFDAAPSLYDDFTTFHYDPTVGRPLDPPIQLEVNLGITGETPESWLSKIEYRFKFGLATHELGYDNFVHETFYPNYTSYYDAVFRNFYGFTLSCTNFYFGTEAVINSSFIGKNKRCRLGYGLGLQGGLTELMIYTFHLEGYYQVDQDVNDDFFGDYIYYFPSIAHKTLNSYETRNKFMNMVGYGLGLIEFSFFEKRKFIMGLQYSMGAGMIKKKSFPSISYFYPSLAFTMRFLVK